MLFKKKIGIRNVLVAFTQITEFRSCSDLFLNGSNTTWQVRGVIYAENSV